MEAAARGSAAAPHLLVPLFGAVHSSFLLLPATFALALKLGLLSDAGFEQLRRQVPLPDVWLFTAGTVGTIYATLLIASALFMAARRSTAFHRYVIQQEREADALSWEFKVGLVVKLVTGTVKSWLLYHLLPDMFMVKLPTAQHFSLQFALIWLTWETAFYWWHRLEHTPWLYRKIHRYHHEVTAPTGFHVVQQTVWSDLFLFTFRVFAFGLVVPVLTGPVHVLVFWLFGAVMMYDGVQTHGGLYLPWLPLRQAWFGGALRHEFHHVRNRSVYGWNLTFWDSVMGTDQGYADFEAEFFEGKAR